MFTRSARAFYLPWMPTRRQTNRSRNFSINNCIAATRGWSAGTQLRLVAAKDDGRIVGFFNLNEIVYGSFWCAYAGWRVSIDVARQGFGTEGLCALLDLAFAKPPVGVGLHRVQANIIPTNEASLKLRTAMRLSPRRPGRQIPSDQWAMAGSRHDRKAR